MFNRNILEITHTNITVCFTIKKGPGVLIEHIQPFFYIMCSINTTGPFYCKTYSNIRM